MKQITINNLAETLKNWKGSAAVGMECVTVSDQFYTGYKGSLKKADKMLTLIGKDPKKIMKRAFVNVLVTDLTYKQLVEKRKEKEVLSALVELQVNTDDLDQQFEQEAKAEAILEKEYEVGQRKNGEAVSGALVVSSKDGAPMINCYFFFHKPIVSYEYDGKPLDISTLDDYRKPEKIEGEKQSEYGIKKVVIIRNYRLENVKKIRMNGEDYTVIA
jgi:hypothetical protein